MSWQAFFSALLKPVFHVIALAASWFGGRKSAQTDSNASHIAATKAAKEIENEVESLDRDTLKRRASKWVRGPER